MRELNWVYYYSNVEKDQNQYTHEECTLYRSKNSWNSSTMM